MPSSAWIRVIIFLAAGSMFALSTLTGDSIDEQGLRWMGGVTGGVTLLLLAFDRWIWRWPVIRRLSELGGARVIHGTWRGTLHYTRDADGNPGEQPIFMAVCQTYSAVKVRCYFPTTGSESISLMAAIDRDDHRHVLRYVYRSDSDAPDRDTRRATEGATELRLVGRPVEEIQGAYYVERNGGKGKIAFDAYSPRVAGSAQQAARLSYRDLPQPSFD